MKKLLFFYVFFLLCYSVNGQNFISWENYFNGNEVTAITEDANYIYVGTKEGGAVQINKTTNAKVFFDSSNSGLVGNRVSAVAKDSQGNIWFGNQVGVNSIEGMKGGLAKYDGTNWTSYDYGNTGINLSNINSITIDSDDKIWLGKGFLTAGANIVTFDGAVWTTYNSSNSGLPNNQVNSIAIDEDDVKWISTQGGGLVKYNNTTWEVFNTSNSNIPHNEVYDVDFDSNGLKWIATIGGLVEFNDTTWTNHLSSSYIYDLEIDANDDKWVTVSDGIIGVGMEAYGYGIVKFINDSTAIQYLTSNSDIPSNQVYTIYINSNDDKLVGTGLGLSVYDETNWNNHGTSKLPVKITGEDDGYPFSISTPKIDSQGNKWFISGKYLLKFDGSNWEKHDAKPSFSGDTTFSLDAFDIDDNDNIWVTSRINGIGVFNGSNFTVYNHSNSNFPSDSSGAHIIKVDSNGIIWGLLSIGLDYIPKGLFKFDGTSFTQYNTTNSDLLNNRIYSISVDTNNHKWIANSDCLIEYDDTNFIIYDNSNSGLPDSPIMYVQVDENDKKWIRAGIGGFFGGSPAKLVSYDGTTWSSFDSTETTSFSIDGQNNLWFCGLNEGFGSYEPGLKKYSGTSASHIFTLIYSNSPIPYINVETPTFEGNKTWISTYSGISVFVEQGSLNIDDTNIKKSISIYPNPTSRMIRVKNTDFKKIKKIEIYNSNGQKIKARLTEQGIDISYLSKGFYFLHIEKINGEKGIFKIIKE
ncbi:two-component regulator propeller domain-containing protein [Lutibacter sp.]